MILEQINNLFTTSPFVHSCFISVGVGIPPSSDSSR